MARRAIRNLACCLLLAGAAAPWAWAQAPQLTREELAAARPAITAARDAAAAYLRERPPFIARLAQRCRAELGMPALPAHERPEELRWEAANYRYTTAAVRYRSKKSDSRDALAAFQSSLQEIGRVRDAMRAEADALLAAAPDRAQTCRRFFADSEAGAFDIGPDHPHRDTLEGLARELFDPPPRP